MSDNYTSFVKRLNESVDRLESCISLAVSELGVRGDMSKSTVGRIEEYRNVVEKQRSLISQLEMMLDEEKWEEVTQTVKSINAMSVMIRDDAHEVLAQVAEGKADKSEAQEDILSH